MGNCPCFENAAALPAAKPVRRAYGKLKPVRTELAAEANAARAPAAGGVELTTPTATSAKRSGGIAALADAHAAARRTTDAARELATESIGLVATSAAYAKRAKTQAKQTLLVAHKGSGGAIQLRILSAVAKSGARVTLTRAQLEPTRLEVGESFSSTLWAKRDDLLTVVRVAVESGSVPRGEGGALAGADGLVAPWAWRSVWCIEFDRRRGRGEADLVESAHHAVLKWKGAAVGAPRSAKGLVRQKGALGAFSNGMSIAMSIGADPTMESCSSVG